MKTLLVVLLISTAAQAQVMPLPKFTPEVCEDRNAVSKEMIELELSGSRWQGGDSDCLKQDKFKTVIAVKQSLGSPDLLDPEYLANAEPQITKQRWIDEIGAVEVSFAYISEKLTPGGKREPANVKDTLIYKVNLGKRREQSGCASLLEAPKHLVMRKSCHHE